jgi:hypothetical protein
VSVGRHGRILSIGPSQAAEKLIQVVGRAFVPGTRPMNSTGL